ncbi:MAG TPA: 50S ribosomal protein L3 [Candidatus Caccosoma faecigallinarum]|uniref:Large ribosomal subunit protein uL3 n=1 Tax=Candidatus Caccosoma faecigallinarum TaxID=2840720 RepID=A0A9D1G7D9_9FIRM|nr:50S ribosomal protein L3 [Candidatus Caccosoma faecigallinarum]
MKAILGRKVGMTQVFATDGTLIPVTVVEVLPNVVLQKRTLEKDGYEAVQLGYEDKKEKNATKAELGHVKKANTTPKRFIKEVQGDEMNAYEVGSQVTVDLFKVGELVDVIGVNKGKGFQGSIKRHGYSKGPMGHGSGYHRGIGSIATSGRTNNRVHPGTKMPGHMGNAQTTILNLQVIAVDAQKNAMLIKGAIPGPNRGLVTIRSAVKYTKHVPAAKTLFVRSAQAE